MSKEIETIKAEINTLSKGIETYHGMVSDKLDSLIKRLNDLTEKEKPISEITQEDWMGAPENSGYYMIHYNSKVCLMPSFNMRFHYKNYNVFKTKELAESRKHLSSLQRKWAFILDYLGRDEIEITFSREFKYIPAFSINGVFVSFVRYIQDRHKSQYATSETMCLKAIKIMGDDIYPYLGAEKP